MSIHITNVNHVNVTVTADLEDATKHFYKEVLGLQQIPKPAGPRQFIGAWYQVGDSQIHLSIEDTPQNASSDRHVCYRVEDLNQAAAQFEAAGIEIIPDSEAPAGRPPRRFFVRDPGSNLIEITK